MSRAVRSLTLIVPGLLDAAPGGRLPAARALTRLLSRADSEDDDSDDPDHALFSAFGIELDRGATVPVAPVTRLLDTGEADDGCWLRADPVHLAPGRDRLLLAEPTTVELGAAEAAALVESVLAALPELSNRLEAPVPQRWYLKSEDCPDMRTWTPRAASGGDAGAYLPRGPEAGYWCALMNEIQMALHSSPENLEREARGMPPINSVWLWGAGRLPRAGAAPWAQAWADDALTGGLARLCAVPASPVPATGGEWLERAHAPGLHLLVLDGVTAALRHAGSDAWAAVIGAFDRDWAQPLTSALRAGTLSELHLRALNGRRYRIHRRALRRFWRSGHEIGRHLAAPRREDSIS